jgi:hypothetical protein
MISPIALNAIYVIFGRGGNTGSPATSQESGLTKESTVAA